MKENINIKTTIHAIDGHSNEWPGSEGNWRCEHGICATLNSSSDKKCGGCGRLR